MTLQPKGNLRCMFCNEEGFKNLDELVSHQYTVDSNGKNICKKITCRIDPHNADDLFPMKVCGKKYAPKNHDGIYMCLDSNGKVTKKPLVRELLK